jgi:hypothetical protein
MAIERRRHGNVVAVTSVAFTSPASGDGNLSPPLGDIREGGFFEGQPAFGSKVGDGVSV